DALPVAVAPGEGELLRELVRARTARDEADERDRGLADVEPVVPPEHRHLVRDAVDLARERDERQVAVQKPAFERDVQFAERNLLLADEEPRLGRRPRAG